MRRLGALLALALAALLAVGAVVGTAKRRPAPCRTSVLTVNGTVVRSTGKSFAIRVQAADGPAQALVGRTLTVRLAKTTKLTFDGAAWPRSTRLASGTGA